MKRICTTLVLVFVGLSTFYAQTNINNIVNESLAFSVAQSLKMAESMATQNEMLPKTTDRFGNLQTCKAEWWVSGFFSGQLWYLFEYSGNTQLKKWAEVYSKRIENQKYTTNNHDIGFIIYSSFGNAYRITGDTAYLPIIKMASNSLSTRFNEKIGCIRSWDYAEWNKQWQFPVIIDNMMNLEMLLWSAKEFNEPRFSKIAISHANITLKNHYRPDFSCYHVVSYDTISGKVEKKNTAQGFSDQSSWARGQAWGLYGYTMMYRYTKDTGYLNLAVKIASFILNHPRLPEDKIPYWDFDAPNIPDCYRDASAGAIICSALLELSQHVNLELSSKYLLVAETQICNLSSPSYKNALGNNGNFILKHSVGNMPSNTEVDVPLSYADYYFVEALMRYKKLKGL